MESDEIDPDKIEFNEDWESDYSEDPPEDEEEPSLDASPLKHLLWSSQQGHLEKAKELLDKDPELIKAADDDGYTALHRACYSNKPEMVDFLLSQGAPMDAATSDGWLPLHSASKWGHYACAMKLLMHGSPLNATSHGGQTALHLAASCKADNRCLRLLLSWPGVDATIVNKSGDTAEKVADRCNDSKKYFFVARPCVNDF